MTTKRRLRLSFPNELRWLYLSAPLVIVVLVFLTEARDARPAARATRLAMGTTVTITALHHGERQAGRAIEAAFAEIERIEAALSIYRDSSEVNRLMRSRSIEAGPDLLTVVRAAQLYHDLSGGAFDITVEPVLEVYDRAFDRRERPPAAAEIDSARSLVGFERLSLSGNTITLAEGTRIDLGGIAKGYIIDRAVETLRRRGIRNGLVNAGGDIRAFGRNNGEPWRIALQNPRDPSDYLAVIEVADRSVTTSGDYERYFDPDREYHHIIDPRTGRSATALMSVTIIAPRAMEADALATSVFVLGPRDGLELVERLEGIEALLITREREIILSPGMGDFIRGRIRTWSAGPER